MAETPATPPDRTDDQRKEALLAIDYEVSAMVQTALRIGPADDQGDAVAKNAYLEACLVHCRCLIELLVGRSKQNDISLRDLLGPDVPWAPTQKSVLQEFLDAIDKHLAHLTWTRAKEEPMWPWEGGVRLVLDAFGELATFMTAADANARSPDEAIGVALAHRHGTELVRAMRKSDRASLSTGDSLLVVHSTSGPLTSTTRVAVDPLAHALKVDR